MNWCSLDKWGKYQQPQIYNDITLMAESEEELKSLLMKVKKESEKVHLISTFKKWRS